MDVDDEHLACIIERPQERRFLAVAGIGPDPAEAPPVRPRRPHHVQSVLALRCQLARRGRNARLLAPRLVLDPCLGKIQPHIDGRVPLPVRQDAKHRHLAVVDLAQPARPLPRHADRLIALLGEARLVENQAAVGLAAEKRIGVQADLRHDQLVLPRRVADEMLKLLRAAAFDHIGHRRKRAT
jgi:hypothetical protein